MSFPKSFLKKISLNFKEIIEENHKLEKINQILEEKMKIRNFFPTKNDIQFWYAFLEKQLDPPILLKKTKKEFGDFQTPINFAEKICNFIKKKGITPKIIIEPTCGEGNFVIAALNFIKSAEYIFCLDIRKDYGWFLKLNIIFNLEKNNSNSIIEFYNSNIFFTNIPEILTSKGYTNHNEILILGNPPWVTISELSSLDSDNIPIKRNISNFSGLDSLTGKSNFDIAEYIIREQIQNFTQGNFKGYIAILCKNSVIRKLIKENIHQNLKISNIQSLEIDAKKEFEIHASASLLFSDFGKNSEMFCEIHPFENVKLGINSSIFGWIEGKFISDIVKYQDYKKFDGIFPYIWRQGVKHDLSKIMILKKIGIGLFQNGNNEQLDLEENLIYPFLKSSDLRNNVTLATRFHIIITQFKIGDDTLMIQKQYPKLWNYLQKNKPNFEGRKSKIYNNKPSFSIFGVGEYTFKPYKIGISGFYKKIIFTLIRPLEKKPIILDDTSYFIYFEKYEEALFIWTVLNFPQVQDFYQSISFLDSKRPYTKEILMRFDLKKFLKDIQYTDFKRNFNNLKEKIIEYNFKESIFIQIKKKILNKYS